MHSLPESPHRPVKGKRLPNLRDGWLETEKGKITRKRIQREKERIFILIY
jgi:hypothetical protein